MLLAVPDVAGSAAVCCWPYCQHLLGGLNCARMRLLPPTAHERADRQHQRLVESKTTIVQLPHLD